MTNPEGGNLSYLRRYRKVAPTDPIKAFLREAYKLAHDESFDGFKEEPVIIASNGLRITQFERRMEAGRLATDALERMHKRLTAPTLTEMREHRVAPRGRVKRRPYTYRNTLPGALRSLEQQNGAAKEGLPPMRANKIVISTKADFAHLGVELGLEVDEGPAASILAGQTALMVAAVAGTHYGRVLEPVEPDQPLVIPFIYGHFRGDEYVEEYIERMGSSLPVVDIEAGPLKYKMGGEDLVNSEAF